MTRGNYQMGVYRVHKGITELVKMLNLGLQQNITVLQPGDYQLIYRQSGIKETLSTKTIPFTIKSGEMKHINLR